MSVEHRREPPSSEVEERRAHLDATRRSLQLQLGVAGASLAGLLRLVGHEPAGLVVVLLATALLGGYGVHRFRDYRRQRRAAGLEHEFDELEYNAGFGARALLILLGMFAAVGVVLVLVLSFATRAASP